MGLERLVMSKQRASLLSEALNALDDDDLTVVLMRTIDVTTRDLGVMIGRSHVGAINAEIRALTKMRVHLQQRGIRGTYDLF